MKEHAAERRIRQLSCVHRDVAQLVARLLWERVTDGDTPAGNKALRAKGRSLKTLANIEKKPCKH